MLRYRILSGTEYVVWTRKVELKSCSISRILIYRFSILIDVGDALVTRPLPWCSCMATALGWQHTNP